MSREIIVIGGGASGMMAAVAAAREGAAVTVIEKMDRIGKKILATGNGRCNYTNIHCTSSDLKSENPGFAEEAMKLFGVEQTVAFFEELGILPRIESEGRAYPFSEQAASVLDVFRMEMNRLNVQIICASPVKRIEKANNCFQVHAEDGSIYRCDKAVIAAGGKAGPQYGCSGDGYELARKFGHSIVKPRPSLVQLLSNEWFFKRLKGVRAKGEAALICNGAEIERERGEIQFTEGGLSGICIFNLSYQAGACIEQNGKCAIRIDFFPESTFDEIRRLLRKRIENSGHKTAEELLVGMLNKKLIPVILKESGAEDPEILCNRLKPAVLDKIAEKLKAWLIPVQKLNAWKDAQVTAGGLDTKEINPKTMESEFIKGLYFCGEIVDVSGRCGGYNLQWAWSSGFVAGSAAAKD